MGTNKPSLKTLCGNCKYYYLKHKSWRSTGNLPLWSTCEFLKRLHVVDTEVSNNDEGCSHWTPATSRFYHHGTC